MMRLIAVWLAAALAVGSGAWAQDGYLLQPGDRIEISVLEDPGLNRTVLVRPDGLITMPLVGTVPAAGLTPEDVALRVRRALARDFIEPPSVTVSLVGLAKSLAELLDARVDIYVIGQVGNPGLLQVELPIDALQALALAGGPGTFAARQRIQIRRRDAAGADQVLLFDYDAVERGEVPMDDISLAAGDVIVVPERRLFE